MGEMETLLRRQRETRDRTCPDSVYVFFWFDYRIDKDGQRIARFDGLWAQAVAGLGERMMQDGVDPIDLHFHDVRRSAHYQIRKAGIDGQTRRDIMGHESTSMDDRYTMIDDEAVEDARRKMDAFQAGRGLIGATDAAKRIEELRTEIHRLEQSTLLPQSAPEVPGLALPSATICATIDGHNYPYRQLIISNLLILLVRMRGLEPPLPCEN